MKTHLMQGHFDCRIEDEDGNDIGKELFTFLGAKEWIKKNGLECDTEYRCGWVYVLVAHED